MPTVAELTALYSNFMLNPRPGPAVCEVCLDFTRGPARCYRCARNDAWLDAVLPISYSVAHEQLHHALASYKRRSGPVAERFQIELAAVLWRFLDGHEDCLRRAARTAAFDVVTTIPSSAPERDDEHPLHTMVGEMVAPARSRFARLLAPTGRPVEPRLFSLERYAVRADVAQANVLLIDDTWTTGASARSAAATLRRAGAASIAALVIGRHLHRDYADNNRRLSALSRPYEWDRCALEGLVQPEVANLHN